MVGRLLLSRAGDGGIGIKGTGILNGSFNETDHRSTILVFNK